MPIGIRPAFVSMFICFQATNLAQSQSLSIDTSQNITVWGSSSELANGFKKLSDSSLLGDERRIWKFSTTAKDFEQFKKDCPDCVTVLPQPAPIPCKKSTGGTSVESLSSVLITGKTSEFSKALEKWGNSTNNKEIVSVQIFDLPAGQKPAPDISKFFCDKCGGVYPAPQPIVIGCK